MKWKPNRKSQFKCLQSLFWSRKRIFFNHKWLSRVYECIFFYMEFQQDILHVSAVWILKYNICSYEYKYATQLHIQGYLQFCKTAPLNFPWMITSVVRTFNWLWSIILALFCIDVFSYWRKIKLKSQSIQVLRPSIRAHLGYHDIENIFTIRRWDAEHLELNIMLLLPFPKWTLAGALEIQINTNNWWYKTQDFKKNWEII